MDLNNLYVQVLFESLLLIGLAGLAIPAWFAFAAKLAEAAGGKAFYGNLSAQFTQTGLLLGLPTALFLIFLFSHGLDSSLTGLPALAGPGAQLDQTVLSGVAASLAGKSGIVAIFTPLFTIHALGGTIFLSLVCLLGRKALRKNRPANAILLLLTALTASCAVTASLYLLKIGVVAGGNDVAAGTALALSASGTAAMPASGLALFADNFSLLLQQLSSPLACSLAFLLAAALCCCCLLAALAWILARRALDDFGRDYYNFALKRCACLAFIFALATLIGLGLLLGLIWPDFINSASAIIYLSLAAAALQGLCCIILVITGLSIAPLRHKLWLVLSLPVVAAAIYLVVWLTHEAQIRQLLS